MIGQKSKNQQAFTLIEVIVSLLIFGLIIIAVYQLLQLSLKINQSNKARVGAVALANQRIETIRNLPYNQVGTLGGIPTGELAQEESQTVNSVNYTIKTDIRYIDDPFDGLIPIDLLNTDYKKVKVTVKWSRKAGEEEISLVTTIAPKGIESTYGGGTLWIKVFDATPSPVNQATVHIFNDQIDPAVNANYQTNKNGEFILPGALVSQENYQISVTKDGYSQSQTYSTSEENPSPNPSHLSVQEGAITDKTFFIDKVSPLTIHTEDNSALGQNWWDYNWQYRKQLTISNNSTSNLPAHYPIKIEFDHQTLVNQNKSLTTGDDIRLVYFNGVNWQEIDRLETNSWGLSNTEIWFSLQNDLATSSAVNNYYIYYNNPAAATPSVSWNNIFLPQEQAQTVGLWHFEDGSGNTLTDSSNNNLDGMLKKESWQDNGYFRKTSLFDGIEDCITINHDSAMEINDDLTIETWVYPLATLKEMTILSKKDLTSGIKNWQLEIVPQGENYLLKASLANSEGEFSAQSTSLAEANQWYHLAMVFQAESQTLYFYINGVLESQVLTNQATLSTNSDPLYLGCQTGEADYFYGLIDHLRISHQAISDFPYAKLEAPLVLTSDEQQQNVGNPIGNIQLAIRGEKTIGTNGEGQPIYKYNQEVTCDQNGNLTLSNLEYDTYHISIASSMSSIYDLAQADPFLPIILPPATASQVNLSLANHQDNTLLVTVKNASQEALANAQVRLQSDFPTYDQTILSGPSGQTFFSPLSLTSYKLTVTHAGYLDYDINLDVSGQTEQEVLMTAL